MARSSEPEVAWNPSQEDVDFYRQHGWFLTPVPILRTADIRAMQVEARAVHAGARDRELPFRPNRLADWRPADGRIQRNTDYIHYLSFEFRRLLATSGISRVAAELVGAPVLRIFQATLIYKPPAQNEPTNIVPWHYDKYYWSTCSSDDMITAFIPFHDCTERHGTIRVVDGSHRWNRRHGASRPTVPRDDLERSTLLSIDANANRTMPHVIPVEIPEGHVSFHHCLIYHGSGHNLSREPREAVSLHLAPGENRFQPYECADGRQEPYKHDLLVRRDANGLPDYSDPDFCPKVWPQA